MKTAFSAERTMNVRGRRKILHLLESAGLVFSKKGYDGAAIRDIAAEAKVPASAFIYHFKNKRNLFEATLRHHIVENPRFFELFNPIYESDGTDAAELSKALHKVVRNLVFACYWKRSSVPHLYGLLICLYNAAGESAKRMISEIRVRAMEPIFERIQKATPSFTDTDIFWWNQLFWALTFYPAYGRMFLCSQSGEKSYSYEFLETLTWRILKSCCTSARIPIPPERKDWVYKKPTE